MTTSCNVEGFGDKGAFKCSAANLLCGGVKPREFAGFASVYSVSSAIRMGHGSKTTGNNCDSRTSRYVPPWSQSALLARRPSHDSKSLGPMPGTCACQKPTSCSAASNTTHHGAQEEGESA